MSEKRPSRRAQQKEETLQLILAAAKKLFAQQGFQKTTIRAIAQEAGVAVGTVFVHFPDKSALLAATLYEEIERAVENAFTSLPAGAPIKTQLLHIARSLFQHYDADRALSRELLRETLFMGGEWGQRSRRQAEAFLVRMAELLCRARASGQLPEDANCQLLATAFFSHYFSVLVTGLRQEVNWDPETQTAVLASLLDTMLPKIEEPGKQRDGV